jgi:hypothetical protein
MPCGDHSDFFPITIRFIGSCSTMEHRRIQYPLYVYILGILQVGMSFAFRHLWTHRRRDLKQGLEIGLINWGKWRLIKRWVNLVDKTITVNTELRFSNSYISRNRGFITRTELLNRYVFTSGCCLLMMS